MPHTSLSHRLSSNIDCGVSSVTSSVLLNGHNRAKFFSSAMHELIDWPELPVVEPITFNYSVCIRSKLFG